MLSCGPGPESTENGEDISAAKSGEAWLSGAYGGGEWGQTAGINGGGNNSCITELGQGREVKSNSKERAEGN